MVFEIPRWDPKYDIGPIRDPWPSGLAVESQAGYPEHLMFRQQHQVQIS